VEISIIIPTYNEEKHIEKLMLSLRNQSITKEYEIILVDNGSDDKTVQIANNLGARILHKEKNCNISAVRNLGAKKARGKYLAFIDADCEADKDWLSNAYSILVGNDNLGIVGGVYTPPLNKTWVQRAWYSVRVLKRMQNVNFVPGGNMFIKKILFDEVGGFNETLETGEDYELCMRISENRLIISDDRIKVIHYGDPSTLIQRLKKEIWYGKNTKDILKNKPFYLPFWLSVIYLVHLLSLLSGLVLINKTICFYSISGILILIGSISFIRCLKAKVYKYYFPLLVVVMFYMLGRVISLKYIISNNKKCCKL